VLRAMTELAQHPDVVYAEPNYVLYVDLEPLPDVPLVPSDPFVSRDGSHWSEASWGQAYPDLWGIRRTRTVEGWNVFDEDGSGVFESAERRPGEGIVVAVIDSGLDRHHPEIAQNVWRNPGEIPDNGVDDDDNGLVDDVWGWTSRTAMRTRATGTATEPTSRAPSPHAPTTGSVSSASRHGRPSCRSRASPTQAVVP
jgi:hypothetical protein